MVSNLPSQDTSFEKKPRITLQDTKTYLKKLAKKFKVKSGGSGSQQYEGTKEILPRMISIERIKKQSGGRIDKALPGGRKYI